MAIRSPSWSDYHWIEDWRSGLLQNAYCLSFVGDLSPQELLNRLRATDRQDRLGLDEVCESASDLWSQAGGTALFVGVASVGEYTLMFEDNGYVGVTQQLMAPVSSEGVTVVAHYRNVNAVTRFLWLRSGVVELDFEPMFASRRDGAQRSQVDDRLLSAGFDIAPDGSNVEHLGQSIFALGEAVSGFKVTPAVLDELVYAGGIVEMNGLL